MSRFVLRRLIQMVPVVFGLTAVIFFMIHLVPGDPAAIMLGTRATPENVAQLRRNLGLDEPLLVQYMFFLRNLATGSLGDSIFYREPVLDLILDHLPTTLMLATSTIILAVIITVPLATLAALHRDRLADQVVRGFLLVGLAMPSFWVGINLLLLLTVRYRIFPAGGFGDGFFDHLRHLFLPALTIALSISAVLVRNLRSSLIDTLTADHVRTARAKGLSSRAVFIWHVLRNSAMSTVTILGLNLGYLMGGTVIIEQVFALPGLGQLLLTSIFGRDYPVVQGITLVYAVLVILVNLITDLVYAALDPRVSLD